MNKKLGAQLCVIPMQYFMYVYVNLKEKKRKGIYSTVVQDRSLLTFEFRTIKGKEQKPFRS